VDCFLELSPDYREIASGVYENTPLLFWRMPLPFDPSIDPAIWAIAPGFRALSLKVKRPPPMLCKTTRQLNTHSKTQLQLFTLATPFGLTLT
jgi:hypothetical protein